MHPFQYGPPTEEPQPGTWETIVELFPLAVYWLLLMFGAAVLVVLLAIGSNQRKQNRRQQLRATIREEVHAELGHKK